MTVNARQRRGRTHIAAGTRDVLVTIQSMTETVGESQFPVEEWSDLVSLLASRADVGGLERFVANQLSVPYETRWGIEYRPDMDPDLVEVPKKRRLVYSGRVHDIIDAQMIERERGIELLTLARRS